jgi:hypothetical protein
MFSAPEVPPAVKMLFVMVLAVDAEEVVRMP